MTYRRRVETAEPEIRAEELLTPEASPLPAPMDPASRAALIRASMVGR